MVPFFTPGDASFKARFRVAKCSEDTLRMRTPSKFRHFNSILHDSVLQFLGPHEILALFRTNKTIWKTFNPKSKRFVLLRSVFDYLCISEECAHTVTGTMRGGWKSFSPLLVRMCEELARIYGHLEPDPAHRCFLAEQACFFHYGSQSCSHGRLAGIEIEWEVGDGLAPRDWDRYIDDWEEGDSVKLSPDTGADDEDMELVDLPTLEDLRQGNGTDGVYWGDECDSYEANLAWMIEHSTDVKKNTHYKQRLDQGLYPVIQVFAIAEGVGYESFLRIGPDLEQIFAGTDGDTYPSVESFPGLNEHDDDFLFDGGYGVEGMSKDGSGGMLDLLLGSVHMELDKQPLVCRAIWCMRHNLEPFDDSRIDWALLIEEKFDSDHQTLLQALLLDSLTNPFFGKANVQKYRERILPEKRPKTS